MASSLHDWEPFVRLYFYHSTLLGATINSLSPEARTKFHARSDFQRLVRILRQIKFVGRDRIEPLKDYYPQEMSAPDVWSGPQVWGYLVVPAPEFSGQRVVKFIGSGAYDPQGTWPGNPIGNIYAPLTDNFFKVFNGEIQVDNQFIQDSFYSSLGVLVPLKNRQGETIAALGLDYVAGSKLDRLYRFKVIGTGIIASSFVCSSLLALFLSRWLSHPISKLQQATQKVREGDYETVVTFESQDELGVLAKTFNKMVAEIRQYSHQLEAQNHHLHELDRLKDEFLANTSHELRTPLNGIIGIAESLLDGVTGELNQSQTLNLQLLQYSSKRLLNLVNDLLDFSKLRHKQLELQLKNVNLSEIVELVLQLNRTVACPKDLQLLNQVSPDLPLVLADENRLQQILHNLIGNAIKFTDRGQVTVTATLRDSERVEVAIADTGIGIPVDKLETIFQSFEQVGGAVSRQYGGTGLGLAITRSLVQLHGGEIAVDSTPGEGAIFRFTLPIVSPSASNPCELTESSRVFSLDSNQDWLARSTPAKTKLSQSHLEGEPRILIVDDEPVNLQVLSNFLSLENYSLFWASDGKAALELLANNLEPDLILLDVMMPRMTGYDVLKVIRQTTPMERLPVIFLSARSQIDDIVFGLELGANDYLIKPIHKSELLARIRTHLRVHQLEKEASQMAIAYERQQSQFLDALPIGVSVYKPDGSIIYFNQMAARMLQGTLLQEMNPGVQPSAGNFYQEGLESLYPVEQLPVYRALHGESAQCDDIEVRTPERIIPLEILATPIWDKAGGIQYAIAAFQDLTERKQSEEIKSLNLQLERMAIVDSLTQVANRYYFDRYLQQEWKRLSRERKCLSLILFDVDYFKRYNDFYGHQAGDDCLRQVARSAQNSVNRPADLVARYGGEEFAAILPNTDRNGAVVIAGRFQQHLRELAIPHTRSEVSQFVSISLGIASLVPTAESSPNALIAMADRALYSAKHRGRDRLEIFAPDEEAH